MGIYKVKNEERKKIKNKRVPKKKMSRGGIAIRVIAVLSIAILGVFTASFLGSIFAPLGEEGNLGWANLEVYYISAEGKLESFTGSLEIDLYYSENDTLYEKGLTLDNFPYYISSYTNCLIKDSSGVYEYQYIGLAGSQEEQNPHVNRIILRKEIDPALVSVDISVVNITYLDYQNPDPFDQMLYEYKLSSGQPITSIVEVSNILCSDTSSLSDGMYFHFETLDIYGGPVRHYVWLKLTDTGSDPIVPGRIGHEADLRAASTDIEVATIITSVINSIDLIIADNSGGTSSTITITNEIAGSVIDTHDEDTGFIFQITTQGVTEWTDGLLFGDYDTYLTIDITGVPFGYTFGVSSNIPPDIFEDNKFTKDISYNNGFNRKGFFLAFDAEVSVAKSFYSASGNFFQDIQVYEINKTTDPNPEKLWVVLLPDIDNDKSLEYRFITDFKIQLGNIYLWSGWLDDFESSSSLIYNQYKIVEQ